MSSANKEEASRCADLAASALASGDLKKARRLAEKAQRLFPSPRAASLLETLSQAQSASSNESAGADAAPRVRQEPEEARESRPKFNEEDDRAAKAVLKEKDYYAVLGVERSASEGEIKKAFRRLALRFHPDKCKAPAAEEAFKCVSRAYECLTDPQKRSTYDRFGPEAFSGGAAGDRGFQASQGMHPFHFAADELTPEDLFNMFFNGVPVGRGGRRFQGQSFHFGARPASRDRRRGSQNSTEAVGLAALAQFLPLIMIFLALVISSFGGSVNEEPFKFEPSKAYSLKRTSTDGIMYYMQPRHVYFYNAHDLDRSVYSKFVEKLEKDCESEKKAKEQELLQAEMAHRSSQDQIERIKKAFNIRLDACEQLKKMYSSS